MFENADLDLSLEAYVKKWYILLRVIMIGNCMDYLKLLPTWNTWLPHQDL